MHAPARTTTSIRTATVAFLATCLLAGAAAPLAEAKASRGTWAPHIKRAIVTTRAKLMGTQVATWYGPGFFGNRTGCGTTLRRETWGIAHRSLPCGSLVTISHKGRTVTVPVIDRGPFSGASLDLTQRTRDYLRFRSGTVRMAAVKRYRLVPLPAGAVPPRQR